MYEVINKRQSRGISALIPSPVPPWLNAQKERLRREELKKSTTQKWMGIWDIYIDVSYYHTGYEVQQISDPPREKHEKKKHHSRACQRSFPGTYCCTEVGPFLVLTKQQIVHSHGVRRFRSRELDRQMCPVFYHSMYVLLSSFLYGLVPLGLLLSKSAPTHLHLLSRRRSSTP